MTDTAPSPFQPCVTEVAKPRMPSVRTEVALPGVGDVIDGRYRLRRELGRGGAGAVFEAVHVFTQRLVALKIVHCDGDPTTRHELQSRLLREAHALATARHPGIVDLLDAGVGQDGVPYLVLERLEGRTLEGLLASRGKLSATDTGAIGLQLADALGAAHEAGVVHRDVKPGNVFLVRDANGVEQTKLVDFGIAHLRAPLTEPRITCAGALIGTPEYMAPEQLLGADDVDARCDVYALGVTLFECLTGTVPYAGAYPQILLRSISSDPPPSVRLFAPDLSDALVHVIDRSIAKTRGHRYPTMAEFARALASVFGDVKLRSTLLGAARLSAASAGAAAIAADVKQRRRAPRAPYNTPVRIVLDRVSLDGRSEDISERGMLVLCRGECATDRLVQVRFASPIDGKVVALHARVRWVKGHTLGLRALGVEFVEVPDDVRVSINRYARLMEDPATQLDA
jgi:eukaryotic-like serine/threonine-protein kinase